MMDYFGLNKLASKNVREQRAKLAEKYKGAKKKVPSEAMHSVIRKHKIQEIGHRGPGKRRWQTEYHQKSPKTEIGLESSVIEGRRPLRHERLRRIWDSASRRGKLNIPDRFGYPESMPHSELTDTLIRLENSKSRQDQLIAKHLEREYNRRYTPIEPDGVSVPHNNLTYPRYKGLKEKPNIPNSRALVPYPPLETYTPRQEAPKMLPHIESNSSRASSSAGGLGNAGAHTPGQEGSKLIPYVESGQGASAEKPGFFKSIGQKIMNNKGKAALGLAGLGALGYGAYRYRKNNSRE